MFGLINMTRVQRLVLGVIVLLIVDIIWVVSSELTEHIFHDESFRKPFFSTYLKTSMFVLYLSGFFLQKVWWQQCHRNVTIVPPEDDMSVETDNLLGDSMYVPLRFDEKITNGSESDDSCGSIERARSVRFSNLMEVRQLSEVYAEEAVLSRMSYSAYLRADEARMRIAGKLSVRQIIKLAAIFSIVFFLGNLSYQEALCDTQAGIVNVLSSTSSLFTLVLASVYPSNNNDKFTLSKFMAVVISMSGVVVVTLSDRHFEARFPKGAIWAIVGALMYALYLVLLRRRVDNEQKLNIPMFFGFVGLFILLFLWPVFFILHYTHIEPFQMPNYRQWMFLLVNGLIGTVISELLWLWGCFLTSSLVATLSLSLTIPMTMIADTIIKGVHYSWMFYIGSLPVFLSFIVVAVLTHYESWDPLLTAIKKLLQCVCSLRFVPRRRDRDLDREQRESLIGINSDEPLHT